MKKNKISKNWLTKRYKDPFFRQSKIQGYRSRSAFKLIEMNKKFKFLKKNTYLLDLGSSPGGWTQVAAKEITKGRILAVDIRPMEKIKNADFLMEDLSSSEIYKKICAYFGKKVDVVISDMAINTSGNKNLDSFRTGELCLNAMELSRDLLSKDGIFLAKIFMGSIFREIYINAKKHFENVVNYKPISSKKESKEIYIFCKGVLKYDT